MAFRQRHAFARLEFVVEPHLCGRRPAKLRPPVEAREAAAPWRQLSACLAKHSGTAELAKAQRRFPRPKSQLL